MCLQVLQIFWLNMCFLELGRLLIQSDRPNLITKPIFQSTLPRNQPLLIIYLSFNDLAPSHWQFIGSQFSLVSQLNSLSEDRSLSVSPKDRVILCPPQAINDTRFLSDLPLRRK